MKLKPIDNSNIKLVADWLAQNSNYQWLDFGNGTQILSPVVLKFMTQRDIHVLRVFSAEADETPLGVVALSHVSRTFKTAMLWYVLGDKNHSGKGYTTRAVSRVLSEGFGSLGLRSVNAWAVEHNMPSIRILERNHFQRIGCQRQCHWIAGRPYDRILFDLLASEHREI